MEISHSFIGDGGESTSTEPLLHTRSIMNEINPSTPLHEQANGKSVESDALVEKRNTERTHSTLDRRYLTKDHFIECGTGGKIKLGGSSIAFPPHCLNSDIHLKMVLGSKASPNLPQNTIMLSPEVGCDLSRVGLTLGTELEVEILAYCYATQKVPIQLLRKTNGTKDWILQKSIMLCDDRRIRFRTSILSKYCIAITQHQYLNMGKYLVFPVYAHLFLNDVGIVKYYESIADVPVMDKIKNDNKASNFVPLLTALEPVDAKLGELFGVELQCLRPPAATFGDNRLSKFLTGDVVSNDYICRNWRKFVTDWMVLSQCDVS